MLRSKAYEFARFLRGADQLAEGFKDILYMVVVGLDFIFQLRYLLSQVRMCQRPLAQTDKRLDNLDIDLNGTLAPEHAGKHGHAVLSKSGWARGRMFERIEPVTICDQFIGLLGGQEEHEPFRESVSVTLHRLVQHLRGNTVKCGQIPVYHDLVAANKKYPFFYRFRDNNIRHFLRFHKKSIADDHDSRMSR